MYKCFATLIFTFNEILREINYEKVINNHDLKIKYLVASKYEFKICNYCI
jgi:hypothetical protein